MHTSWFVNEFNASIWYMGEQLTLTLSLLLTHSLYLFSHFSLCWSTMWEYLFVCVCVGGGGDGGNESSIES